MHNADNMSILKVNRVSITSKPVGPNQVWAGRLLGSGGRLQAQRPTWVAYCFCSPSVPPAAKKGTVVALKEQFVEIR